MAQIAVWTAHFCPLSPRVLEAELVGNDGFWSRLAGDFDQDLSVSFIVQPLYGLPEAGPGQLTLTRPEGEVPKLRYLAR
jgi:hypothetical protein